MANEVNESTKWLYEQLNGKGYNVGKDVNEFDSLMRSNADSRQWAYDTAKKSGLNVGKDIDEFSSLVGGTTTSAPVVEAAPIPANDIQPKTEAEQEAWKPTPMQKAFMIKSVQSSLDDFNNNSNSLIQHTRNMAEYMKHGESIVGQPAKAGLRLNPEVGSVEEAYITPSGYKTTDKAAADNESFNHRRYVDNMTVAGQLRRAGRDLDYLTDKAAKRRAEIIDEVRKRQQGAEAASGLLDKIYQGIRSGDSMTSPSGDFMDEVNDVLATDREYRALEAARREAEKRVQTIQHENDRQEDKDVGFWRGLREVVSDSRTWDFGLGDMRDAMTKVAASSKQPENRSDAEHMMIEQAYEAQQAEVAYSQNDSFWNRAGVMTGEMLPFMLDFAIMGGAKSGATTVTRGLDAILLRSIHKTAPKVARNKAVQWTTKALGALPEDLLYRAPLMTNTVQGMKTSADIIDRKLGDVVIRDDGSYDFSNDKTWGSAVWQGEANAIIENYSEMFGPHLEGVLSLKTVGKLADTFGAKRLSGILTKASNSELAGIAGTMQKHLDRLGVSDYFGEVGEEYYGQLWRTMLNLDDAYKQNPDGSRTNLFLDGQFHGDIWGGMALSMGLMGAGKYTLSAAAYGSMKHRVNKTDARASETFTPEVWEGWRERIDGTTNDKVGEMAEAIVADPTLTDEQRTAAMNYMEASLNLRGFNLASLAHQRGGEPSEEEVAANESYMDGYSAETPQEMNDAKRMLALQRQRLASSLSEDVIPEFDADPIGALSRTHDSELRRIASDYVNAKQVYEGMIQRVRDDIDGRIAQSDAMIDSRVNHQTGMIQPATMKIDDRKVYIVNGTVSMYDDGSGIDIQNSSESIIIRDAETGKVEFADPTQLFNIEEGIDAETEKDSARSQIIEETTLAAADNIDGVLSFTPGDIYPILDLEGNQQSISVLGQTADENGMAIDGHVDIQYSDGSIEAVATSDLQQWVDKANEQRVAQFIVEQESEPNSFEIVEPITETQPELIEAPQKAVEINPETENSPLATEPDVNNYEETPASFISRIPVDESTGEPIYEQAEPADAWDAIVESAKGNEDKAQRVVESMVSDMEAEVKRLEKQKPNKGRTIAEKMAAEDALEEARTIAQSNLSKWKAIAGVRESRITEAQRLEAEAELKRQIEAEQEARRIERQARDEERASRPGEYAKAMSAWEEPTSIEERILRDLSSGGIKLRWSDKGKTRGLGAHLFGGSNTERRWNGEYGNYKWLVDDNAGLLPEEYAERLSQEYYNDYENDSDHYTETFGTILDILGSYASSKDMWERAQELHQGNLEAQASAEDFERMEMEARGITEEDVERDRIYREQFGMPEDEWDEFYSSNGTEIDMPDEEYSEYFNNLAGLRADQENEQQGLQQTATDTGEQGRTDTVSENSTGMVRDAGLYWPEASEVWQPEGNNQESGGDVSLRDDEGNGEKGNITQSSPSDINLEEQDAEEDVLRSRIEVKDDDWTEGNGYTPTLKRTIIIDGTHNVTQVDTPDDKGDYTGSVFEYDGKTFGDLQEVISHIDNSQPATIGEQIAEAEAEVNTAPTDAQKEAGNYKKGHVQVGTFDVTIENPKGSKRSGTDADGKQWETTMTHTYGYIRGTKGVDGDHIDVFISSDVDAWNGRKAFVVDQYNPDGSFDEHKVMLGFNDRDEAFDAYLSNYESGWENGRRLDVTPVNIEDFEKWIASSKRKTKPFAEYKSVKSNIEGTSSEYVIVPKPYTNRQGKTLDTYLVTFNRDFSKQEKSSLRKMAKDKKGWYDRETGGWMLRSREDADAFAKNVMSKNDTQLSAEAPLSIDNMKASAKIHNEITPKEPTSPEIISGSDLSKLDESLRNEIMDYISEYPCAPLMVISDNGDIDNLNMPDWFKEELKEEVSQGNTIAGYCNLDKKIYIFANAEKACPTHETLLHENTHAIVDKLGDDCLGFLTSFKEIVAQLSFNNGVFQVILDGIKEEYVEEKVSNEFLAYSLQYAARYPEVLNRIKQALDPKTLEYLEVKILNRLYGQRNESQKSEIRKDVHETFSGVREEDAKNIPGTQSGDRGQSGEADSESSQGAKQSGTEVEAVSPKNPSGNKLVTDEQYAELLAKMRKKMDGQLNMGVDPEILAIGSMMAVYHIERGARKFAEYVKAMVADLGEKFPARYLKGFYKAAHEMIEDAAPEIAEEMDSDDVVSGADITSILSGRIDAMATAEMVVAEGIAEQERQEAEKKLKEDRNKRLNSDGSTTEAIDEGNIKTDVTSGGFIPGVRKSKGRTELVGQSEEPKKKKSQKKSVSSQSEQPNLFDDSLNKQTPETTDSNGQERIGKENREILRETPRTDSGAPISLETREMESGLPRRRDDREGDRGIPQGAGNELGSSQRPPRRLPRLNGNERKNTSNNRAERGTDYAPKGDDARIKANIAAIELAHRLTESGEQATPELMETLRKFSGWGGLGKAFTNKAYADRIRKLLGDSYQDAVDSRKSAYYTPAAVIDSLWDIVKAMGFQGGTILEGSAGIGNILGLMPEEISERSEIRAVEVDSTTGSILSLLYPDAQVDIQGFEDTKIENGSIDLAITNVPFITGWNVIDKTGDKDLSKKFKDIHDFCIAKNIRKLRDGGIGIFITSSGTLDNSAKLRAWVTNEGNSDVVGAFRLHNETFGGTGATSDIIVVRKRVNGKKSAHAIDVSEVSGVRTAEYDTGETKKVTVDGHKQEVPVVDVVTMDYNRYFVEHPEQMAGEMHFGFEKGEIYRAKSKALYPVKGMNQEAMLSAWAQSFSDMDFDAAPTTKQEYETTYDTVGNEVKVGSMVIDDHGRLCVNSGGIARPLMSARKNKQDTRTDDELISMFNSKKIKGRTRQQCLKDYNGIKKALTDVLEYQTTHEDNDGLEPLLSRLNATFDSFVSRYGNLHKNKQLAWLRNDVDYPGILALETYEERGDESGNRIQKFGKTDIFSRRVVEKETIPQPKNVKDGIITSLYISGRVDVGYISEQLGISEKQVREEIVSSSLGFENPVSREMEVSYEYLSGNVREKLRQAIVNNTDGKYDANIKALEKVVPMNIPAHLIEFALGSSWIEPQLYEDYVKERTGVNVNLTNVGGTWFMKTSGSELNTEQNRSQGVYSEELKKTVLGHEILEAAITNRSISVSRTYKRNDGTYETITDRDATQAVAAKVDEFRMDFKDWARAKMQGDMEMSARMETVYNDRFNNSVPRSIPDEFIPKHFGGQVTEMGSRPFSLRPHQAKAVIRGTTQSQLLAHEVGTGKTFTLISTAMEMRRLGTARKPMIVVQNATVGQFVESAKALYPNAKVLTLEDADRNAQGRKDFYAKIRYNDWDMIVIPQSVLDMIPDSEERQIRFIQDKIAEKMLVLQQMAEQDPDGSSWITKQAEKEISDLENDLAKITASLESKRKEKSEKDMKKEAQTRHNAEVRAMEMLDRTTDDVENFDQMGIDALLVDEAHEYKHLGFATAMQRGVKGVDPSYSKKAQGLYLKTQAVMERNRGRNVIFATGTPISNTAAEIWTFMRYLMPEDEMRDYGIYYFDDFVRNFGNLQQMLEFATNGKFKENNRFAGYVNLPELVRIWSTVTDTVLTREAGGVSDKIPDMEGGKAQDIYLPQTKALRSVMLYVKSELDRYDKMTGKEKKANSHIPLTMYGIAKAAAVDARLVYSDAADEPQSKTNEAVRQTLRSLEETSDYKGTVAIFADNYQNKQSGFNLYEDIRRKLIKQGVPAEQIVVMKSGMTVKKKLEIFDKVNAGEVRVILGSTYTLGTGVNIQERLHTLIHLDAPNRPMDYTQRNGRILRQGNLHKDMGLPVRVLRFGVEDSLDVTAYQRLKTKGAIADSIMNGSKMMENSMETRSLEEDEDVFGDITAQLSGSEYAMLKNQAEKEVCKLNSKLKQWEADQTYIHNQIPRLRGQIRESEKRQKTAQENLDVVRRIFPNGTFKTITIGKQTFSDLESMNKLFTEHNKSVMDMSDQIRDNKISGPQTRKLTIDIDGLKFEVTTVIDKEIGNNGGNLFSKASRKVTYSCSKLEGVEDIPVSGARLKGAVEDIVSNLITGKDYAEMVDVMQSSIDRNQSELQQIEQRKGKEFEFYTELAEAKERLEEYTEKMKAELAEKEAKYADMDADVEVASDISLTEEDSEETEEEEDDAIRYRLEEDDTRYRIREDEPPTNTGIGYKVFVLKNGMLYPPMVANPNGASTPVGVWLDADAAPVAGTSKTGRQQVKAGGKGTQGGSGKLAYRPGWHLGVIPYALQFNRKGESGEKELFPANFVWAEVEYANDIDYQEEAMSYGYNKNGKFQHSYAGLPRLPINGAYKYRTNPNPETDPWIITGAMKVNRLLTPTEVDEMVIAAGREPQKRQNGAVTDEQINELNTQFAQRERDGYGAYSDTEVSMENDPWSKAWGESIRTKRQQKQFAERERKRMQERAKSLSSILGLDIEVIEDASSLKGKKQRAKGWYDTKTGKITVVVSNHNSASDMEATILHEAVAHHGLRQLLGEHFDEFLDKVYEAAENGIKEHIDLLASRNGWNRRVATEEYLAGLAERTDFDRAEERIGGWFDKIKRFFIDMLFKAGFKHIKPGTIGDNELRYILWRSYQNLANPGRYRAFEWEAEDVAMQYKLQVGEYDATSNNTITAADDGIRFRDGDFTPRDRAIAAQQYERMLSRGSWQFREATQDSMLGLKTLYESILGSNLRIENVAGYENAYLYENRMSSANNGEQHQYFSRFMKPLLESIHKLCGSKELDRRILTDYMIAKHGLERNEYMRKEAATNGEDTERDFAGLCGLTGEDDWQVAETVARQMVDDYETDHDTAELWDNVKKATNAILETIYLSGLISEDTYNKVLGMYDFYIPLRGWDETTSDEVYGYLTSKDGPLMGSVFKTAEGRESKADDPIATIAMMADDAIRQGNRNIMKQRFLNFVHGNPSDLVSINEMWLQHNDVTDQWEPVFADLQPDMTHAEVESEIAKFEAKMEALRTAEPDKYKKGRDARNIPYKVVRGNLNEHQVLVKRNGRTYVMTINGNPRAAQALNGLTNPNVDMGGVIGNMLKLGEYVNRQLSAFYTTRNPDFVVSNFLRDMLYSNCMTWVKENPRYALRFHKNFGKVNPLSLRRLLSKWENDSLSDSNYLEKMFKEFMLNGGETGYTSVKDIEGHKRTIASELKKQGSAGRKAWSALGMQLDLLNRSAENCARFAAFLTSREMGRTLDRSIHDAKEVSVNFNKKGSGGKFVNATGQKFLGKLGSYLGGGGRIAYVFWNAGIQGMTNFGRAGKRNPGKALGGAAALFTLGYVIPLLAQMLGGGDGDDDDKNAYYNLPEYVRRSNICFKAGEQWITIPLPIEYRAIYGMGELACGVISGNERYSNSELTRQMASQISQVMPLDMLEGGGGISPFIPSAFKPMTEAYILNKGWTGLPVYKDTPYNKNDPEWTKAYQSADQHLVAFTRWLNETSGGNDYKKGAIDINPAKLEYLLSGTFGGAVSTTGKLKKMGETALGEREFEWRNMLLANRVIKSGDERTANRKLQNEYFKYLNEYEETNRLRKKYENAADDGILGYAERADFLYNSPEYLRFEIFEEYKPDIDAIREEIKEETDPDAKKELQNELFATMRELVDELHRTGK